MTKKYTNRKRREVIKLSASFLIALFIFSSCKKEITTIGADINPNGLNVIKSDTFTVVTKTVIADSLPTNNTSVSLLGGLNDPEVGIVDCGIVTQLRLSSEAPNFGNVADITVDSVVLSFLYATKLFYGNITDLTFEVYEITDQLNNGDDYYANTSVTTTGSNLVIPGTETQEPSPYANVIVGSDTVSPMLRLNLTTAFGDYLISNADQMNTNENFITFLKGLYIKVTNTNSFAPNKGTVLYFALESALSNMVLYYTIGGENKKFTFNINTNTARFNKIDFNYTGTPLEASLNSTDAAQEKIYLQGSHLRPEFSIPFIEDLKLSGNKVINHAELIVPVQNFTASPFKPSNSLFLGRVSTSLQTDLTFDYPNFTTVNLDDENTYRFDLTREIQRILSGAIENASYRLYPTNFFGSSIERTIFSGPKSIAKDKTKLVITYTEY